METKDVDVGTENPVIIWNMNYGFECDLNERIAKVEITNNKKKMNIDIAAMKLYNLVFGIYEAKDFGIPKLTDTQVVSGLSEIEIQQRLRSVRQIPRDKAEKIFSEIRTLNAGLDENGNEPEPEADTKKA